MSNYKAGDKFEIEIESVYDDNTATINVKTNEIKDNKLYRIKGFNSLVFDENGLNKLKKIEQKPKTVKASELAEDTEVTCWSDSDGELKYIRHFALLHKGHLYAYYACNTSEGTGELCMWEHMTLKDGTIVLPE